MSGVLMSVAEEEDKRLLMPASDGCLRLVVDVERLSATGKEEEHTREAGFTQGASQWERDFRCRQRSTKFCKFLMY